MGWSGRAKRRTMALGATANAIVHRKSQFDQPLLKQRKYPWLAPAHRIQYIQQTLLVSFATIEQDANTLTDRRVQLDQCVGDDAPGSASQLANWMVHMR